MLAVSVVVLIEENIDVDGVLDERMTGFRGRSDAFDPGDLKKDGKDVGRGYAGA